MNITIVGAGAIGSLWACKLNQAGHQVTLQTRDDIERSVALQLDQQAEIVLPANHNQRLENSDLVMVCVKAWQVKAAIEPLLSRLHPDTILLFMHNGMGAVDQLAERLTHFPVVLATTTQAAYKPQAGQVLHTGFGNTQLGAFNPKGTQCRFLAEVLNHALPEVTWNDHIHTALWQKLAINCAINPLTAIHQIKNGQLGDTHFRQTLSAVTTELAQVMQQEGISCDASKLLQLVYTVIEATADNYSSMQQDIAHQRPSEIEFITGYLCRCAKRHGLTVPANEALYQQIKQLEQSWQQAG